MKKVLILCLLMSLVWAVPRGRDYIDDGSSANLPHRSLSSRQGTQLVDSSANAYSAWTNIQSCLAFEPTIGALQFVCRHYTTSGHLDVHQADAAFSFWVHDMEVYLAEHGNARYPTSVASDNGPHIGFPILDPITGTWGHMGAQHCAGGWYSSFWSSPVDLSGDIGSPRSIGVKLPTGDLVFVCDNTDNTIPYYTMSADLNTTLASGNLASNSQIWGIDCNGGVCYVFWYDVTDLSIWYVSSTDGITWTTATQWVLTYPSPFASNVLNWPQMALTDAGDPILIFDLYDGNDVTYPFSSKVYVSNASGATPVEVSDNTYGVYSYPTIAAGGGNVVVIMQVAMDTTLLDSLAYHDVFCRASDDDGATWDYWVNLTESVTERTGLPQAAKRLDATNGNFFYFYGVNQLVDHDPYWHCAYDPEGLDPHAWFVCWNEIPLGIAENESKTPSRLTLNVRPNPVSRHTSISYALTTAGDVSLQIFDLLGRNVSTVESSYKNAGVYTLNLDTSELANGTYFLVLDTDCGTITRSFVVVR